MNPSFYVGAGLIVVALALLVWAVKTKAPAHFHAQALVLGELGLMAFANALIADEMTATVVMAMLGLGALVSIWMQLKLVRRWRTGSPT